MIKDYKDLPLQEYVKLVDELMEKGWTVHTKFTCLNCGARQIDVVPNRICTGGYSCEECGQTSHPEKFGCAVTRLIERAEETGPSC